jgi:hypothetical protein
MMKESGEVIRNAIKKLVTVVEDRVTLIAGDLIEPLNMYIQHHNSTSDEQFTKANKIYLNVQEKDIRHEESKKLYFGFGHQQE